MNCACVLSPAAVRGAETSCAAMADREYAPLSAVCVRTLSDKVYEKRKAAAFEIEK